VSSSTFSDLLSIPPLSRRELHQYPKRLLFIDLGWHIFQTLRPFPQAACRVSSLHLQNTASGEGDGHFPRLFKHPDRDKGMQFFLLLVFFICLGFLFF
jgi:hypothetical protein